MATATPALAHPTPLARPKRRSRTRSERTVGRGWIIATYVALVFFLIWTISPFIWMILASIKTNKEIYNDFTFWPKLVYGGNYQGLFSGKGRISGNFSKWLVNSAEVAIVVTSASIVLGALAAYSITRLRFLGR